MLSEKIYTKEYLRQLRNQTKADPSILERVIFAFGLLEAISKTGLPFYFKGGSSLMLLLEKPRRLSTDIDILVEPGTDIDHCIREAGKIFPFSDVTENIRIGKNNIEKRHFRFRCLSLVSGRELTILLDVVFEKPYYLSTVEKPIRNSLLLNEGTDLLVKMSEVNSLLGDKLTAFAPHTTGIPFGTGKELEVIKQFFDCAVLFDSMTDLKEVKECYERSVKNETGYRKLNATKEEVLTDSIRGCACIASRGKYGNEYSYYKTGISGIRNHIINGSLTGETAGALACRVMYLFALILSDQSTMKENVNAKTFSERKPELLPSKWFYISSYGRSGSICVPD